MEEEAVLERQREELRQAILDQEQVTDDVSVVHIGYLCAGPKRCASEPIRSLF
jgi:hypothetical protein